MLTDPTSHITDESFSPGTVYPTTRGRWVFSIVQGEREIMVNNVCFQNAASAKQAMRCMVKHLNQETEDKP